MLLALVATALPLGVPALGATAATADVVVIEVLSGRGDLVSGGDALLQVTVPGDADAADLTVDDDGRDVTEAFVVLPDGTARGLVTGLDQGTTR